MTTFTELPLESMRNTRHVAQGKEFMHLAVNRTNLQPCQAPASARSRNHGLCEPTSAAMASGSDTPYYSVHLCYRHYFQIAVKRQVSFSYLSLPSSVFCLSFYKTRFLLLVLEGCIILHLASRILQPSHNINTIRIQHQSSSLPPPGPRGTSSLLPQEQDLQAPDTRINPRTR